MGNEKGNFTTPDTRPHTTPNTTLNTSHILKTPESKFIPKIHEYFKLKVSDLYKDEFVQAEYQESYRLEVLYNVVKSISKNLGYRNIFKIIPFDTL